MISPTWRHGLPHSFQWRHAAWWFVAMMWVVVRPASVWRGLLQSGVSPSEGMMRAHPLQRLYLVSQAAHVDHGHFVSISNRYT